MNQAQRVVEKFSVVEINGEYLRVNGVTRLAKLIGATPRAIYRWINVEDGMIPTRSLKKVREAALKVGILLTADDLYGSDQ